ncbi:MAG: polysaccharide deacetylase family protein, partial [Mucilaginibacter polytrichastri]|nr:polysaccharide deacetylase family protein [Mucilaginibacter polytrichastri]
MKQKQQQRDNIPVLMYHGITGHNSMARNRVHISSHQFTEQMQWLADHGYHTLSLDEFCHAVTRGEKIPAKSILLTFDDGYHSQLRLATPVMEKLGMRAVLFLTVD